jgi:hypothetical protein
MKTNEESVTQLASHNHTLFPGKETNMAMVDEYSEYFAEVILGMRLCNDTVAKMARMCDECLCDETMPEYIKLEDELNKWIIFVMYRMIKCDLLAIASDIKYRHKYPKYIS